MSDRAEGTVSEHENLPEHQEVIKEIAQIKDWIKGSALGSKGADKRLSDVETFKLEIEKVGVVEKFPGMRKVLFDLKDEVEGMKGSTMSTEQATAMVQRMAAQIGETVAKTVEQTLKEVREKKEAREEKREMTKLERLKVVMQLPLQIITAAGLVLVAFIQFWPRK
jgi:hypothetical protein